MTQKIAIWAPSHNFVGLYLVSDIAIFVLKRDVKLQLTNCRAISSQIRHISTVGKNLLSSNVSSKCPHNMVIFGPLAAEIGSTVWGTSANFNGFRVLAALLHGTLVVDVSQTLQC